MFLGHSHFTVPELDIIDQFFGECNVTVSLQYTEDVYNKSKYSVTLNVSIEVTPSAIVVSNGTHFELVLLYNTQYNISAFITLCEFTGPSTTSEIFYGKNSSINNDIRSVVTHMHNVTLLCI